MLPTPMLQLDMTYTALPMHVQHHTTMATTSKRNNMCPETAPDLQADAQHPHQLPLQVLAQQLLAKLVLPLQGLPLQRKLTFIVVGLHNVTGSGCPAHQPWGMMGMAPLILCPVGPVDQQGRHELEAVPPPGA